MHRRSAKRIRCISEEIDRGLHSLLLLMVCVFHRLLTVTILSIRERCRRPLREARRQSNASVVRGRVHRRIGCRWLTCHRTRSIRWVSSWGAVGDDCRLSLLLSRLRFGRLHRTGRVALCHRVRLDRLIVRHRRHAGQTVLRHHRVAILWLYCGRQVLRSILLRDYARGDLCR